MTFSTYDRAVIAALNCHNASTKLNDYSVSLVKSYIYALENNRVKFIFFCIKSRAEADQNGRRRFGKWKKRKEFFNLNFLHISKVMFTLILMSFVSEISKYIEFEEIMASANDEKSGAGMESRTSRCGRET